jgi:fatty-acyl-CoA synthase
MAEGENLDAAEVRAFVRKSLAGYKTPKLIVVADRPMRASNGKADYPAAKACAEQALAG